MGKYSLDEYNKKYVVGYAADQGYLITELGEGFARQEMKIEERHMNPIGTIHGGVVFALADSVGGLATRTLDAYPTTCSSTISYMRPTMNSEKLIAEGRVLKRGKNTIVVDISVKNDKNIHVAQVLATYFDLGFEK